MANTMMLAWGIPLDAAMAGASIQAYTLARPSVRAFELYVRIGARQHQPIGRLPPELVHMICIALEDELYYNGLCMSDSGDGLIDDWTREVSCVEGTCTPFDPPKGQ